MAEIANYNIVDALESIVKDKGISIDIVLETIKSAILSAIKKKFGTEENARVEIDPTLGTINVFLTKKIVLNVTNPALEISKREAKKLFPDKQLYVGDSVDVKIDISEFGRNAIQVAKQRLIQKIKETEREIVFADFRHKVGEIITGQIQRIEKGNVIVNLGKTEGVIPRSEQVKTEHYPIGKTIKAYVKEVRKDVKETRKDSPTSQVILSRKAPEFVKKLFEFEVPEIYEGRVQIVGVSREAGERTKIAVYSTDERVDPVGACVGLKGTRVQAVVRELFNEKIDIIPYSADIETFVKKALAPAEILESFIYADEHKIVVIVPDNQLSLAIGKGGINARLAAKLTGWKITLFGEQQYKDSLIPIENLGMLTPEQVEILKRYEIDTVQKLARMKEELLRGVEGIGASAKEILSAAKAVLAEKEQATAFTTGEKINTAQESKTGSSGSKENADKV